MNGWSTARSPVSMVDWQPSASLRNLTCGFGVWLEIFRRIRKKKSKFDPSTSLAVMHSRPGCWCLFLTAPGVQSISLRGYKEVYSSCVSSEHCLIWRQEERRFRAWKDGFGPEWGNGRANLAHMVAYVHRLSRRRWPLSGRFLLIAQARMPMQPARDSSTLTPAGPTDR